MPRHKREFWFIKGLSVKKHPKRRPFFKRKLVNDFPSTTNCFDTFLTMSNVSKSRNFFDKMREGITNLDTRVNDLKSLAEANKRQASVRGQDCLKKFQTKIHEEHLEVMKMKNDVANFVLNFDAIEHSIVELEKRMTDFISGDHCHDESTFVRYNFPVSPPPKKIPRKDVESVQPEEVNHSVVDIAHVTVEFTPGLTTKRPDSTKKASKTRVKPKPLQIFQNDDSMLDQREDICQPIIPSTPKTRSMSSKKNHPRAKSVERTVDLPVVSKALDRIQTSLGQSTPTQPIPSQSFIRTAKLVRSLKKVDIGTPQLPSSSIPFNDKARILRPRK